MTSGRRKPKAEANAVFDVFVETYGVKYNKAVAKLIKDRDVLLVHRPIQIAWQFGWKVDA